MSAHVDVVEIKDLPDGGADIIMDMDSVALRQFARVGILKVLTDEAERVLAEHGERKTRKQLKKEIKDLKKRISELQSELNFWQNQALND